jgi:CheY-like chemotaxis protein
VRITQHDESTAESPRRHPAQPPPPSAEDECEGVDLDGVRVLVVDDEPDSRELAKRVLGDCGAKVLTAGSADEAEKILAEQSADVILSDIGMPERDGFDLIRSLRSQGISTPAAALTAFTRAEDRLRALHAGYQIHLAKPVEPAEMIAVVASLAGRFKAKGA